MTVSAANASMTTHFLPANASTTRQGVLDHGHPPILDIDSGDVVVLETLGMWGGAVTPSTTFDEVLQLRRRHAGQGPHTLTGPIQVRGARAGMVLNVEIEKLVLNEHGFNLLLPSGETRGLLSDAFDKGSIRHFALDRDAMTTRFSSGITLPLRPFLGIMAVAPEAPGAHISSVPGNFGGNIDCPELGEGATLHLPIWVEGALFYAGDAHAVQGCGEVCQTALETSFREVRLRFSLDTGKSLVRPRISTPAALVTLGFDPDLRTAARQATADMVAWLSGEYGLRADDAYVLCSLQADLMITQIVNGNNGVHMKLPRRLLERRA